jgi:hypothetical protein
VITHLDMLSWLLKLVNSQEGRSDEEYMKVDAARLWLLILIGKEKAMKRK